jgi:hypothetical protein
MGIGCQTHDDTVSQTKLCSDWPFSTAFEASMLRPINSPVMEMWSRVTPMNAIHEKRFIV